MGKRKKSSRKPQGPRRREPLGEYSVLMDSFRCADGDIESTFTCLFCHHDKSVSVRMDRKEGIAQLFCKVCDQRYQSKVNRTCFKPSQSNSCLTLVCHSDLTEPIDIYSEWIDAADAAEKQATASRPTASSSRHAPVNFGSDAE